MMVSLLFGGSAAALFYTYLGYPALLAVAREFCSRPWRQDPALTSGSPSITLLVAAWNEEGIIEAKIRNSLELDYPRERLSILIVSDGSDDRTVELANRFASEQVHVLSLPRGGKTAALNRAMKEVHSELVVFSDANVMLSRDALRKLARHFVDPSIGGVSGDVQLRSEGFSLGAPQGLYYRLERFVQTCESQLGSMVGADGGCYGIRRELFTEVPTHLINDDFIISMEVVKKGRRLIYDPEVAAIEESPSDAAAEFRRKIRVEHGNFQSLFSGWGVPSVSQPWALFAYLSHKVMRWTAFVPLSVLIGSSVCLSMPGAGALGLIWVARGMTAAQAMAYLLALLGWRLEQRGEGGDRDLQSGLTIPYYFVLENVAAVRGLARAFKGLRKDLGDRRSEGGRAPWNLDQWGRAQTASRMKAGENSCASS